jgi:hypothetical protein
MLYLFCKHHNRLSTMKYFFLVREYNDKGSKCGQLISDIMLCCHYPSRNVVIGHQFMPTDKRISRCGWHLYGQSYVRKSYGLYLPAYLQCAQCPAVVG